MGEKKKKNSPLGTVPVGMGQTDAIRRSGQTVQSQCDITRSQIDNPHARNISPQSYKNRQFNGSRKATDEYAGKTVFYSSKGVGRAKNDPRHFTTARTANIDHITPIDVLIKRYGKLVPAEDLKIIANSDYNLAVTNEALNKCKGGMTNLEYLLSQLENGTPEDGATALRMLAAQIKSKSGITIDITDILLRDAHQAGIQSAQSAAFVGCAICLAQNICWVYSGDITVKTATENVAASTAEAGLTAYAVGSAGTTLKRFMLNSKNEIVKNLGSTSLPTMAVTSAIEISSVVQAYVSGKISGEQALEQLGKNGAGTLAAGYGAAIGTILLPGIGTIVGSMVGYMISSSIYESCMQIIHSASMVKADYLRTKELCEAARAAMHQQRLEFEAQVAQLISHRQIVIDQALQTLMDTLESPNTTNYTQALSALAAEFGRELPFQSDEEFDQFMSDKSASLIF